MSKCNLSADQLTRAADIVRNIYAIDKMEMFLNYAEYKKIDIDEKKEKIFSR